MEKRKSSKITKNNMQIAAGSQLPWVYEEEMHRKIELAAYLQAEKDGFRSHPHEYWLLAEIEVGCTRP